jgi:DNA-binding NarL/FixJ family response regulator
MRVDVLVVDDHAIIREGLKKILADTDDLVVAGEAANGDAAIEMVGEREWGLVILDISMPGKNGLELVQLMRAERPKLPILIFSMHQEDQYAVRAIRAGADGYLSKEDDADMLLPAIRKVVSGGKFISPRLAELLATEVHQPSDVLPHALLSNREYEVLVRIVRGVSLTAIAEVLSLSIKTISTHKTHILEKMGMQTQTDLIRYALAHNLLDGRDA